MNLYLTRGSRDYPEYLLNLLVQELAPANYVKRAFDPKYKTKISRRGSCVRCPKYEEFGHFTLLVCRKCVGNVPKFEMHVQSYCSAH